MPEDSFRPPRVTHADQNADRVLDAKSRMLTPLLLTPTKEGVRIPSNGTIPLPFVAGTHSMTQTSKYSHLITSPKHRRRVISTFIFHLITSPKHPHKVVSTFFDQASSESIACPNPSTPFAPPVLFAPRLGLRRLTRPSPSTELSRRQIVRSIPQRPSRYQLPHLTRPRSMHY